MKKWRLIEHGASDSRYNMAVDRALFESFKPGQPVFRLYQWYPAAISAGRFQNVEKDLMIENCRKDGVSIVKRMTGGGAILHHNELTYSLVCEQDDIGQFSVKESYRIICDFLLRAYHSLGFDARFALTRPHRSFGQKSAVCFAGTEAYDIEINGKKIGGNAQRRHRKLIFQHGSIPVFSDLTLYKRYFKEFSDPLETKATTLRNEGLHISISKLTKLVKKSFEESMGILLISDNLRDEEKKRVEEL